MKDTQQVQEEMKKEGINNKSTDDKNRLLGFLNLNMAVLTIVISISMNRMNNRLYDIRESIDLQNLLMLKLMMNGMDGEYLPSDTVSYQDAQRLYVQTMQQKNSGLLKSVAYNK